MAMKLQIWAKSRSISSNMDLGAQIHLRVQIRDLGAQILDLGAQLLDLGAQI